MWSRADATAFTLTAGTGQDGTDAVSLGGAGLGGAVSMAGRVGSTAQRSGVLVIAVEKAGEVLRGAGPFVKVTSPAVAIGGWASARVAEAQPDKVRANRVGLPRRPRAEEIRALVPAAKCKAAPPSIPRQQQEVQWVILPSARAPRLVLPPAEA
jgi:hypothetical protein